MKVLKPLYCTNCSRLLSPALFFLLVKLFVLALPLNSKGQDVPEPALLEVQPFSENTTRRARRTESVTNVGGIARSTRFVYVRSHSVLVTAEDIENKLHRHPDFQRLGLIVTRNEMDADLILEVEKCVNKVCLYGYRPCKTDTRCQRQVEFVGWNGGWQGGEFVYEAVSRREGREIAASGTDFRNL